MHRGRKTERKQGEIGERERVYKVGRLREAECARGHAHVHMCVCVIHMTCVCHTSTRDTRDMLTRSFTPEAFTIPIINRKEEEWGQAARASDSDGIALILKRM